MNRRAFLTRLGATLAAPLAAEAQQPGNRMHRIGFLAVGDVSPENDGSPKLE
jgi:hypothetical protein